MVVFWSIPRRRLWRWQVSCPPSSSVCIAPGVPRRDAAEVDASCVFHSYCDLTVVDRSLNYRRLSEMSRSFPQAWVALDDGLLVFEFRDKTSTKAVERGDVEAGFRLAEAILAELGDGPVAEIPQLRCSAMHGQGRFGDGCDLASTFGLLWSRLGVVRLVEESEWPAVQQVASVPAPAPGHVNPSCNIQKKRIGRHGQPIAWN